MAEIKPEPQKPSKKRATGYLFIPQGIQRAGIILWLRRMHAWIGIYGAIFFFCLGLTGFYLNHRGIMQVEGGQRTETASLSSFVEPGTLATPENLASWMQKEFEIKGAPSRGRTRPRTLVTFDGSDAIRPGQISISFRGPNALISGTHEIGSNVVQVTRSDPSLLKGVIDLHKVIGVNKVFVLLMDTIAGAMMFMSLSGVLLWTRLHGPRLAAVGIFGSIIILSTIALSGSWIAWVLP